MTNQNLNKLSHFQIEDSIIDQSYSLNSMILAQYDVNYLKHPAEEYWCIFINKFQEKFETNFMRELVSFAGTLRVLLDVESISVPVKNKKYLFDQSVGELYKNGTKESLSFREAYKIEYQKYKFSRIWYFHFIIWTLIIFGIIKLNTLTL